MKGWAFVLKVKRNQLKEDIRKIVGKRGRRRSLSANDMEEIGRNDGHAVIPCWMEKSHFLEQPPKQNGRNHQLVAGCGTGCEE